MSGNCVKYLNLKVSDSMKTRINQAFEQEGIDWTSLAKACIYDFVTKVEAGKKPKLVDQKYLKLDQQKDKFLQIQLTDHLSNRLDKATEKMGISKTAVVLPYLIKFTIEVEQKHKINKPL